MRAIRRRTARRRPPSWLVPIPHSPAFCRTSSSAIRTSSRSCPRPGKAAFAGISAHSAHGRLDWTAGVFHTENFDDILNVTDPTIRTRGYFTNAGDSLRQGVEASLEIQMGAPHLQRQLRLCRRDFPEQSNASRRRTILSPMPTATSSSIPAIIYPRSRRTG